MVPELTPDAGDVISTSASKVVPAELYTPNHMPVGTSKGSISILIDVAVPAPVDVYPPTERPIWPALIVTQPSTVSLPSPNKIAITLLRQSR